MKIIVEATLSVPVKLELDVPDEEFKDKGTYFAVRDAVLDASAVHVKIGEQGSKVARIGNAVVNGWAKV